MPCITYETPDEIRQNYERGFEHNSKLADTFCQTMQQIEDLSHRLDGVVNFKLIDRLPEQALKWWADHKERDRRRLIGELEQLKTLGKRKAAIKKMTPYERMLVGPWMKEQIIMEARQAKKVDLVRQALSKLSAEEIEALGLKA